MKNYNKFFLLTVIILLVIIIFAFVSKLTQDQPSKKRPNLILISVDSLRSDHVSSYGYYRKTTPNIDNLASEGVLFKNYIAQSYLTPISEMAVHTGLYPSSSGMAGFDAVLPKNFLTLAQILKIYGYKTAAIGNSPEFIMYPGLKDSFDRGFDLYNLTVNRQELVNQENIFNFLRKEKDKPFFLWLPLGSAHDPYGKFSRIFGDVTYSGAASGIGTGWIGMIGQSLYKNVLYESTDGKVTKKVNLSNEDIQYVINRYDDDIFATDKWIGDFLAQLKSVGLDKNTIIIVQSEHGEDLNEHGYMWHYDIFDTTLKRPLIIKNPELNKKNLVVESQTQSIDLLPTILDFLNIPKPHQVEGFSLVSVIEGKNNKTSKDYVFVERTPLWERVLLQPYSLFDDRVRKIYSSMKNKASDYYSQEAIELIQSKQFFYQEDVAVRTNKWKLIYRKTKNFQEQYSWWNVLSGSGEKMKDFELYNLETDPYEKKNVIEEYPNIAKDLEQKIFDFIKKQESKKITPELKKTIQEYF